MRELDFQNNNEKQVTLNYPVIIGFILILALIGGGLYWYFLRDNNTDDKEEVVTEQSSQNDENTDSSSEKVIDSTDINQEQAVDETTSTDEDQTVTETSTETTEAVTQTTTKTTTNDNTDNIYFIVSGAFKSESNAQNSVEELKNKGYNAVIVGKNNKGLYIVAYEGFPDIKSAKVKLNEIRQTNSQAWIYKKMN